MEILHQQAEIITNRYQITTVMGRGGMGTTYAAVDLNSSQPVAIKLVSLRQARDWKVLELFAREAKVLKNLNHPSIPNYLDYFQLDTEDDKRFYLVQELIEGRSLAELVEQGWHATEAEVKDIARQVLDILIYLHSLTPPVIHRDIKPQNIIRRDDGKVYLVDFGAVQDVYRNTVSLGKTFVGTLGYMSLEHLRGNVTPTSDLYSLGCSLLFLLTRKSPTDLPQKGMAIDFKSQVNLAHDFANWLEIILQPIVEDRYKSAEDALKALNGGIGVIYSEPTFKQPEESKIVIEKQPSKLLIKINNPARSSNSISNLLFIFGCVIFWNIQSLIVVITNYYKSRVDAAIDPVVLIKIVTSILFSYPNILLGIILLVCYFLRKRKNNSSSHNYLEITPQNFIIEWTKSSWFKSPERRIIGNTQNIAWVNLVTGKGRVNQVIIAVNRQEAERKYYFGAGYISDREAKWLVKEISAFLEKIRS